MKATLKIVPSVPLEPGHASPRRQIADLDGRWSGFGRDVKHDVTQPSARHAVDQGMMHLGQVRDTAVLDTLNEPQLPQRSAAVPRVGHQAADQLLELAATSGWGSQIVSAPTCVGQV